MLHFDQVSTTLNIPIEIIRDLNPQYRTDVIPATTNRYALILPQNEISKFIEHESEIYAKDSLYLAKYLNVNNLSESSRKSENRQISSTASKGTTTGKQLTHKVKSGDNLGAIASKYKVKVSDIQSWNKIKGTNIRAGQNLTIYRK